MQNRSEMERFGVATLFPSRMCLAEEVPLEVVGPDLVPVAKLTVLEIFWNRTSDS